MRFGASRAIVSLRVAFAAVMRTVTGGFSDGINRIYRNQTRRQSKRAEGISPHTERKREERTQAGYREGRQLGGREVARSRPGKYSNHADEDASIGVWRIAARPRQAY